MGEGAVGTGVEGRESSRRLSLVSGDLDRTKRSDSRIRDIAKQ
jgi:hypothetical protein